ncbi:MAG: hypothetical protein WCX48_12305, partial [Bacteroidales bacterium]
LAHRSMMGGLSQSVKLFSLLFTDFSLPLYRDDIQLIHYSIDFPIIQPYDGTYKSVYTVLS